LLALLTLLSGGCATRTESTRVVPDGPEAALGIIAYCDLVHNAARYDGRAVVVQGEFRSSLIGEYLSDPSCRNGGEFANGFNQNLLTHIRLAPPTEEAQRTVWAPLEGIIPWDDRVSTAPAARVMLEGVFHDRRPEGYGHSGFCSFELDVTRIVSASRLPN
jgi:hypothetical protein